MNILSLACVDSAICCVDSVSRRADTDNMVDPSKHTAVQLPVYQCTSTSFKLVDAQLHIIHHIADLCTLHQLIMLLFTSCLQSR